MSAMSHLYLRIQHDKMDCLDVYLLLFWIMGYTPFTPADRLRLLIFYNILITSPFGMC